MSCLNQKEGGTTRREFVKKVAVGVAAVSGTGALTASRASAAPVAQASEVVEIVPGVIGPKNGKYA